MSMALTLGRAGSPGPGHSLSVALRPQRPYGLLGTRSPGRPPRPSHSFCALKSWQFSSVLLYVHRDRTDCSGRGAQDGHLHFHTAPELCLNFFRCCFTSTETRRTIRDGQPRTATSSFTQLLSSEISGVRK